MCELYDATPRSKDMSLKICILQTLVFWLWPLHTLAIRIPHRFGHALN